MRILLAVIASRRLCSERRWDRRAHPVLSGQPTWHLSSCAKPPVISSFSSRLSDKDTRYSYPLRPTTKFQIEARIPPPFVALFPTLQIITPALRIARKGSIRDFEEDLGRYFWTCIIVLVLARGAGVSGPVLLESVSYDAKVLN